MKKVLVIVTNHSKLGDTQEDNGTFAPELTHALHEFEQAGFSYDIASIKGGPAPLYGMDMEDDEVNKKMLEKPALQSALQDTRKVSELDIDAYAAIFYPGGFGLLSDLADNEEVAALAARHYEQGGVLAAVCHGPAGLLPITLSDGKRLLEDKQVTGFTREEEVDFGTIDKIPYLLEERLARSARRYIKGQPWQSLVIEDERVITGQNPASASAVGKAVVSYLGA